MAGMSPTAVSILRPQILDRRRRLEAAATAVSSPHIDEGLYGLCETCHEPIETEGIAASLLMTHLSATLRSLLSLSLPMPEVTSRANRLFCEGTLASHYATLVCGRVAEDHGVEICNAGHCPPLIVGDGGVQRVESPGLPLGMFCHGEYPAMNIAVTSGESLVLYTDGVTEARDPEGNEFGEDRLIGALSRQSGLGARDLTNVVLSDLSHFRRGAPAADDLTLLVIQRRP